MQFSVDGLRHTKTPVWLMFTVLSALETDTQKYTQNTSSLLVAVPKLLTIPRDPR